MKNNEMRWMKAFSVTAFVVLSVCASQQIFAQGSTQSDDWYVRIIAENNFEGLIDRGTVLGELSDGSDNYDAHDLPELEPFSEPYLTVVFNKDNWGDNSGSFNSDFKRPSVRNPASPKEWRFTVRSDDPARDVTLSWESDHRLDQMVVVDVETGQEFYPVIAGKVRDYSFNMNGKTERDFIWKY